MSGIGVADAPHGTHLGYQVRNGRDFIGRVEHLLRAPDVMTPVARRMLETGRQGHREPQYMTYWGD